MKVPENARSEIAKLRAEAARRPDTENSRFIGMICDLALAYLDLQAATGEEMTEEMLDTAERRFQEAERGVAVSWRYVLRETLNAVAPAFHLAGERRGLEKARDAVILLAAQIGAQSDAAKKAGDIDAVGRLDTAWSLLLDASGAIRALGRPA